MPSTSKRTKANTTASSNTWLSRGMPRGFPNEAALERLVSAVLVEIDDKWAADTKAYIKWECQDA